MVHIDAKIRMAANAATKMIDDNASKMSYVAETEKMPANTTGANITGAIITVVEVCIIASAGRSSPRSPEATEARRGESWVA